MGHTYYIGTDARYNVLKNITNDTKNRIKRTRRLVKQLERIPVIENEWEEIRNQSENLESVAQEWENNIRNMDAEFGNLSEARRTSEHNNIRAEVTMIRNQNLNHINHFFTQIESLGPFQDLYFNALTPPPLPPNNLTVGLINHLSDVTPIASIPLVSFLHVKINPTVHNLDSIVTGILSTPFPKKGKKELVAQVATLKRNKKKYSDFYNCIELEGGLYGYDGAEGFIITTPDDSACLDNLCYCKKIFQ